MVAVTSVSKRSSECFIQVRSVGRIATRCKWISSTDISTKKVNRKPQTAIACTAIYDLQRKSNDLCLGFYRPGGQLLARLESDGLPGGDRHLHSRSRITTHSALARLDDKNAKAAKLDP